MVKTNKNLKDFDKTNNKKENNKTRSKKRNNNGGQHMSQTYSLDSLENEEFTFLGLTIRNWAIALIGFGIIGYNINYNKQLLEKQQANTTTIYKIE
jgi:hypothetical protein